MWTDGASFVPRDISRPLCILVSAFGFIPALANERNENLCICVFMSRVPSFGEATNVVACSGIRLSLDVVVCNLEQGSMTSHRPSRTCCAYPGSIRSYPASAGCRHLHREAYGMWMLGFLAGRLCGLVSVAMDPVREGPCFRCAGCKRAFCITSTRHFFAVHV